ncbi:hypothetical protein K503DRAFT_517848 [Rhizopogon vinicolor AM-OR11-026]|uniref:Uncharacterized protein n=1 Tax=Rhizopogon vinicolor AM-OR11-026 TaxID=1314800 RepID=A0A1B7MLP3_9AGAM|nr:hypothetical protein K503DRAFT_517848 [Rhizopogon vinicolor AM-OR11-026]
MSDELEIQVPPPKHPRMDHTGRLLPPRSRCQQENDKGEPEDMPRLEQPISQSIPDLEHDGAPLPKFKRQCHLTHNDDDDISPALKSRCGVVYTVDDEDEHNSTPHPKPVKYRYPLPNYEEDGDDSEVALAPEHRRLPSAAGSYEECHGAASHHNSMSIRMGLGQPTEQHRDDDDDLAPRPKPNTSAPSCSW